MTHTPHTTPPAAEFLVVRGRALVVIDIPAATSRDAARAAGPSSPFGDRHASSSTRRGGPRSPQSDDFGDRAPRLYRALLDAGLVPMGPGRQPEPAPRLAWRADADTVWLEVADEPAEDGSGRRSAARTLLRIPRGQVDPEWLAAARGARPTTLVAGLDIGLQRDEPVRAVLARLETAADRGHLLSGRVGLARAVPGTRADEVRTPVDAGRAAGGTSPLARVAVEPGTVQRPSKAARIGLLGATAVVVAAMVGQTVVGDSSDSTSPPPPRPTAAVAAGVGDAGDASPPASTATPAPVPGTPAPWVVAGPDGTPVRSVVDGPVDEVAAAGLTWPILEEGDGAYRVATHCNRDAWVSAADVERPDLARGDGLGGAVIVLDAGHGGIDAGVPSSSGLLESDLNLVVAERLQALLERSNDIDPETGAVTPGDQHPPVAAVLMTRDAQDAKGGNQRTALVFRGRLATVANADALLSIHHNAGDVDTFSEPPVEVFYSVDDDASPRLAALVVEELRRSFAPLADTWRGATLAGAIGRRGTDGDDYYTVLEEGRVPAVITEALYLSDPAAAALAATEEFQRVQAEALYRALVRFLDTDEAGGSVGEATSYPVEGSVEPYDYSRCRLAVDEDQG